MKRNIKYKIIMLKKLGLGLQMWVELRCKESGIVIATRQGHIPTFFFSSLELNELY